MIGERTDLVIGIAARVMAHKEILQSILESLDTTHPKYAERMLALNSIIGSAEMYEEYRKELVC